LAGSGKGRYEKHAYRYPMNTGSLTLSGGLFFFTAEKRHGENSSYHTTKYKARVRWRMGQCLSHLQSYHMPTGREWIPVRTETIKCYDGKGHPER